jgi:hypothetical protein
MHAVRTFIVPKLHFVFANSIVLFSQLDAVDKKIRNQFHKLIGGTNVQTHFMYSSYKDGGINVPDVRELYYT